MLKNKKYWQKRFELLESNRNEQGLKYLKSIEKQYISMSKQLEADISVWYQRFANNNEITLAEARKLLNSSELREFKWTVNEYIKYGKANEFNSKYMKQLENASARVHIGRLDSLKLQLQQQVETIYSGRTEEVAETLESTYKDSYFETAFEVNKGTNIGIKLGNFSARQIETILSTPWTADKVTFSTRLWTNQSKLFNNLNKYLAQGIALGQSPTKIIRKMTESLNADKSKIARLVMTESAAFSSKAQKEVLKDLNVEQYEYVATLDSRTSEICRNMDGKVFKMSDYVVGLTAPPLHPWCRSVTVPYFEDNYTERFARDNDGNAYHVDGDIKYKEWYNKFAN